MKTIRAFLWQGLVFVALLSPALVRAYVSTEPLTQVYSFKFKLSQETYEYSQKSTSYEEAFERAAQACFSHFKAGRHISEDRGLEIIDVCANPRS